MSIEQGALSGRLALVTGASRGIGEAIAQELGYAGATVVGTATSPLGVEAIDTYLHDLDLPGFGIELDLGRHDTFPKRMERIVEAAGAPVTILINNAGITRDNLALKMTPEEWLDVINVDLNGPALLTIAALRGMFRARQGDVVTIGSVVGARGEAGQSNYAAAKSGLEGFTRSMAKEYGTKGLRFNVVAPGYVATEMTSGLPQERIRTMLEIIPLGRALTSKEVASVVLDTIVSDKNGEVIAVDGGLTPGSVGPLQ